MKVSKAMDTMDPNDIREAKVMQDIVETAFKQNRLLDDKSTENIKDITDYSNVSKEELKKAQEDLLK